jgi:hypothetical protein
MVQRKNNRTSNRRKKSALPNPSRNINDMDVRGDIPKTKKFDLMSASCSWPRISRHFITQAQCEPAPIVTSNTAAVASTFYLSLSSFDNVTPFVNLFDQYRIECIKYEVRPVSNAIGSYANASTSLPPLHLVIDYDNATALGSVGAARSYDNCMIIEAHESAQRIFQPRIAVSAYAAAFGSYANEPSPWIDTVSTTVAHYGLKWYVPAATAAQTFLPQWDVYVSAVIAFRNVY